MGKVRNCFGVETSQGQNKHSTSSWVKSPISAHSLTIINTINHFFLTELNDYKENKRSSPDYTLYLSFGQSLFEPIKKALVVVKVGVTFCFKFYFNKK